MSKVQKKNHHIISIAKPVFGKEEHLVIPASEFLTYAQQEAELPPSELPEI